MTPLQASSQIYTHPSATSFNRDLLYDTAVSQFHSSFVSPYNRYTFPSLYAIASRQNYLNNHLLLMGDEYFNVVLYLQLSNPLCAGCPDTIYNNTDANYTKIIYPAPSACSSRPDTISGAVDDFILIRPHALDSPVVITAPYSADSSSFVISQVLNISRDHPDNLHIYIDTTRMPSGLSIDSITPYLSAQTIVHIGPYLVFDLGFKNTLYTGGRDHWDFNATDSLKFYFHWRTCPSNLSGQIDTIALPFLINWSCGSFPTSLPDSSCHIPVSDIIPLEIDPTGFSIAYNAQNPDTFSSCDLLHFKVTITSRYLGDIHGVTNHLHMPSGLSIVPNSVLVKYDHMTPILTSITGDSVYIPTTYLLGKYDTITLSFTATPDCHYNGALPLDTFFGINFCNQSISSLGIQFHPMRYVGSHCGPFLNAPSITPPSCYGDSNGHISISAYGSTGNYVYTWSPYIGTVVIDTNGILSLNHLPANTYYVTVTNPLTGCYRTDTIIMGPSAPLNISTLSIVNPLCAAFPNGSIIDTVTGGTSPYRYFWSDGSTSQNNSNLMPGSYSLTVSDASGCTATISDSLIARDVYCCVSTDTPFALAQALTFSGGTSTQFLQNIASYSSTASYVSTNTLNGLLKYIYIDSIITLDADLHLIGCPHLLFAPQAGIRVTNGYSLYIQGSTLYACSDTMWQGIEVSGTGSMVYTLRSSNNNSYAMIRDARKGIYSHDGAKDSILDCKFINDWDGIYLDGSAGIPLFSVSNCKFASDLSYGGLKYNAIDNPIRLHYNASSHSDVGVYIKSPIGGIDKATVGSMTGGVDSFLNINCGVYCWLNSLEVIKGTFDSIQLPRGVNNHYPSYNPPYLGRAIYVADSLNTSSRYNLKIGDKNIVGANKIGYCYRGLDEIGNTPLASVLNNRITNAVNAAIYMGPDLTKQLEIAYNEINSVGTGNIIPTGISLNFITGGTDRVHNNSIKLIDPVTYPTNTSTFITPCIGIKAVSTGRNANMSIDSNQISYVQTAIYTSSCMSIADSSNIINLDPIQWSVGAQSYWTGISSISDQHMTIKGNLINGGGTNTSPPYTADSFTTGKLMGIYIRSQTGSNTVSCNGIENTHWSIAVAGIGGSGYPQQLKGNRFFSSKAGVTLYNNGYIGPQGSISGHDTITFDNEWDTSGTVSRKMAEITVNNANIAGSPFYLRGRSTSRFNPNILQYHTALSQLANISINTPYNSIVSCSLPSPTFPHRVFMDILPYLESFTIDSFSFPTDSLANIKWVKESFVGLIQEWPDIIDSSSILNKYYSDNDSLSYVGLMVVFNNMQTDSDATNQTSYQSVNAAAIPLDQNEENLKTINSLYLKYYMTLPDSIWQTQNLDSTDLTIMYNIASQCPLSGGPAVYLARSMYCTAIRDNSPQFDDDCLPKGEDKMLRVSSQQNAMDSISGYYFKLYPNLINKNGTFKVNTSENGSIIFYNLLGQIVYRSKLTKGINDFSCSQMNCQTDIVLYQAMLTNGKIETGKIVTLK